MSTTKELNSDSILTKKQTKEFTAEGFRIDGGYGRIKATVRYDDQCGNGYNSFGITANITRNSREYLGGCCHDEIIQHFPELEPYIKWHGSNSNGPTYYVENTMYHVSNKDVHGKTKGQPFSFERKLEFNKSPIHYKPDKELLKFIDEMGLDANWSDFELSEVFHDKEPDTYSSKWTFTAMLKDDTKWYKCPFDSWDEACRFIHGMSECNVEILSVATMYGKGKTPDIEAGRNSAIWPDATLEQLQDKQALEDRLPSLISDFRKDLDKLGLVY